MLLGASVKGCWGGYGAAARLSSPSHYQHERAGIANVGEMMLVHRSKEVRTNCLHRFSPLPAEFSLHLFASLRLFLHTQSPHHALSHLATLTDDDTYTEHAASGDGDGGSGSRSSKTVVTGLQRPINADTDIKCR